jgi:small basic protein (TIGR04137 family)
MTMDKSLRPRSAATRARSVLTRHERIMRLKELDRWQDGQSPLGLPKVRVYKLTMKKKKKRKEEEETPEAGAAAGTAAPAPPAGKK